MYRHLTDAEWQQKVVHCFMPLNFFNSTSAYFGGINLGTRFYEDAVSHSNLRGDLYMSVWNANKPQVNMVHRCCTSGGNHKALRMYEGVVFFLIKIK